MHARLAALLLAALLPVAALASPALPRLPAPPRPDAAPWLSWPEQQGTVSNGGKPVPFPLRAWAAYDAEKLYVAAELPLGRRPYAGEGAGIAWFNDAIELRLRRADGKWLQLLLDAGGFSIVKRNYQIGSAAKIGLLARAEAQGFTLLFSVPWQELGMKPAPGQSLRFSLHPQKREERPFRFQRYGISYLTTLGKSAPSGDSAPAAPAIDLTPEKRIVNFGKPGYNAPELLSLLPAFLDWKPETAVILVGTNDCTWRKKRITANAYAKALRGIVGECRKHKVRTVLVTIPPCIPEYTAKREKYTPEESADLNPGIERFNAEVRKIAAESGSPLVEFHACFQGDLLGKDSLLRNVANSRLTDGLHPTAEGYRRLAELVADAIRKHNLPTGRIACCGDSITYGVGMEKEGTAAGTTYPGQLRKLLFP